MISSKVPLETDQIAADPAASALATAAGGESLLIVDSR